MKKTLTVVTLLAAGTSQAAGLAIDTQSSRATGMGSTGVASSRDSSSIYYNPAGILGINKLDAQLGDSLILANLGFTPAIAGAPKQDQNTVAPPPHGYVAYKFTDQLAAGVGVFTPFGADSKWPDDFIGRQLALQSNVTTFDINPTVAYAPLKWLRIGAGAQIIYGSVSLTRVLPLGSMPESTVKVSTNDWGFGFNAGVQVDVLPDMITVGATYRSRVNFTTTGTADFRDIPAPFASVFADTPASLDVTLPSSVGLGVSFTPLKPLTLAVDVNWMEWSTIQELAIELESPPGGTQTPPLPKRWKDVWNFHVGAEYMVTDALAVRLGFIYDPTPTPEDTLTPDLPDASRLNFSAGLGYKMSNLRADLGYQLVLLQDQTSTSTLLPGTYSGTAHVIGLTLGYSM